MKRGGGPSAEQNLETKESVLPACMGPVVKKDPGGGRENLVNTGTKNDGTERGGTGLSEGNFNTAQACDMEQRQ